MAVSAEDIARLRRMVNEPTMTPYSDVALSAVIARYAVVDAWGNEPLVYTYSGTPAVPTPSTNPLWVEGYDLHSAAAEIWEEKAADAAQDYDFTAPLDDGTYRRSQKYEQYMKQARWHQSRRSAGSIKTVVDPVRTQADFGYVFNLNDPYGQEW